MACKPVARRWQRRESAEEMGSVDAFAVYIEFQFTDGIWRIPAYIIARDRASYFAENDTGETGGAEYDKLYQAEYTYTLGSEDELLDWLRNNMNWEDVAQFAFKVKEPPTVPYKKQWDVISNEGKLKVVTVADGVS